MPRVETIEIVIKGMDCAECARRVQEAVARLPGVESADVLLSSEKLVIRLDPARGSASDVRETIERMGYSVAGPAVPSVAPMGGFTRRMMVLLAVVFGAVLGLVVAGEWLGLFERVNELIPLPAGVAMVIAGGFPVFRNVARAALRRQITAHTLMTVGAIAAFAVGEWVTAAIVVVFMRVGDYVERFTAESARRAVKELIAMAPQTARVERDGAEVEVPASAVKVGEVVIVRPGERIPVDGEVIAGHAVIDQPAITGESMPVEVARGSHVFAATIVRAGSLRVKT
ncbi:MAG: cation transporter, partial [Candidatus Bipolaricaulaceae bacterium]